MLEKKDVRVLIIEDDKANAIAIAGLLKLSKCTRFDVTHAKTLKEGLNECRNYMNYDVIILDLVLPNGEGLDVFKEVHDTCNGLPVVVVSGYEDKAMKALKKGAQDYLLKPDLNADNLSRAVRYAIERKKLENENRCKDKKYKELVDKTKAMVYEVDFITQRFTYVNHMMCQKSGYTKEELLNMGPNDIISVDSMQLWLNRLNNMRAGKPVSSIFEVKAISKSGEERWVLITADHKRNEKNIIVGARVVALDITEKKVAEEIAKKSEKQLRKVLDEKLVEWNEASEKRRSARAESINVLDGIISTFESGV